MPFLILKCQKRVCPHSSSPAAVRRLKGREVIATALFGSATRVPSGLLAKALFVLGEMERRLAALGYSWGDTTVTQIYTVHDIHPFLAAEIVRRGAARSGVTWHFSRPPVKDLEYEMDCRSIGVEHVES